MAAVAEPLFDLSSLHHRPAGAKGFVRSEGGRLVYGDGTPARFWGTNIHSSYGFFPSHDQAERAATTLSRLGCNVVRLHLPDYVVIDYDRPDHQTFVSDETLERFDYLVKCLIDHGIYLVIDGVCGLSGGDGKGNKAKRFTAADGVADGYSAHRPGAYMIPRFRELARGFAHTYLSRRNVHTGRCLAEEPAVVFMTMQNEQSTLYDWRTQEGIPQAYARLFEERFAAWLREAYTDRQAFLEAWKKELGPDDDLSVAVRLAPLLEAGLGAASGLRGPSGPRRRQATVRFLQDAQAGWDRDMAAYLRSLGVRVPINGTNLICTVAELYAQRVNDLTACNAYFGSAKKLDDEALYCENRPLSLLRLMAGERNLESRIAASRLAGLPVTSTETGGGFPMEWRSSYGFGISAIAALQGWDAVMHYCYFGGYGVRWDVVDAGDGILQPQIQYNDPAIIGLFPSAALMYLRGDVAPAQSHVQVLYDQAEIASLKSTVGRGAFPYGYLTHVARVDGAFGTATGAPNLVIGAMASADNGFPWPDGDPAAAVRQLDGELKKRGILAPDRGLQNESLISDTGELRHDWGRGVIVVDTPRTQGVSGFPGKTGVHLRDVTISLEDGGFATVTVCSLDGQAIASSRRLLLTAVARAENESLSVSYDEVGSAPDGSKIGQHATFTRPKGKQGRVVIEPVRARVTLPGTSAKITAVAGDLSAAGAPVSLKSEASGRIVIDLSDGKSIWYILEMDR